MRFLHLFGAYFPHISLAWLGIVFAFGCVVFVIGRTCPAETAPEERARRSLCSSAFWTYAFLLLVMLVLSRGTREKPDVILEPFRSWRKMFEGTWGSFEWGCLILFNALLFLPLGFFFALDRSMHSEDAPPLGSLLLYAAALGGCTSLLIETLQLVLHRGVFELDDILHNTLGTVLGALLWHGAAALLRCIIRRNDP